MNTNSLEGEMRQKIDRSFESIIGPSEFFFFKRSTDRRKSILLKYLHFKENRQMALTEIVDMITLLSHDDAEPAMYVLASSYLFHRLENYEKKHEIQPFTDGRELQEYFKYLFMIVDPQFNELNKAYRDRMYFAKSLQKDYMKGPILSTKQPSKAL